jgi:formylglycine-generating enzyme
MIDPAIGAIIGALITAISSIVVVLIQNRRTKPPDGILLPPSVTVHRSRRYNIGFLLLILVGGILGFVVGLITTGSIQNVDSQPPIIATLWGTWSRPIDKMKMLYVRSGTFQMGSSDLDIEAAFNQCLQLSDDCDQSLYLDESPQHSVTLSGFWIDQTEVTNAQYSLCVDSGQCTASIFSEDIYFNQDDHPVVGISWFDAMNYCIWADATLPTEAQWEYAARGDQGNIYPWGNIFDGTKLNFCDASCKELYRDTEFIDGYIWTAPVISFPSGKSWIGAYNMSGNVWEWVSDWYGSYPTSEKIDPMGPMKGVYKVIRGGSWLNGRLWFRVARRGHPLPDESSSIVGFRCVIVPSR